MRHFWTIAKYLPLVLCLALAALWAASVTDRVPLGGYKKTWWLASEQGSLLIGLNVASERFCYGYWLDPGDFWLYYLRHSLGEFYYLNDNDMTVATCPILCVFTLLLPLAIGAINRFRFRLWMWFAYTALVAAECAYYASQPIFSSMYL